MRAFGSPADPPRLGPDLLRVGGSYNLNSFEKT